MRKERMNEKGLTLVEILAALTILGIVFISFMTIFPQMTNFNSRTEAKLETMNLAKQELNALKSGERTLEETYKIGEDAVLQTKIYRYGIPGFSKYECEVIYFTKADLEKNTEPTSKQLNKVHIKIYNDTKVISETFGYLEN